MAGCRAADISAYIDGELSPAEEFELNIHLTECPACSEELNRQKTFLNFVGTGLSEEAGPDMPHDFIRVVTTTAESGVRGVRGRREFLIAAGISLLIGASALVLLGSAFTAPAVFIFQGLIDKTIAVVMAVGHAAYSLALGIAVITRALTGGSTPAATALFAGVLFLILVLAIKVSWKRTARSREF